MTILIDGKLEDPLNKAKKVVLMRTRRVICGQKISMGEDLEDGQELNSGPFMSDQDFDAYQMVEVGTMTMDLIGLDFNSPNTSSKTAAATTQTNASPPSSSFSSSSSSSRFSDLNSTPLMLPKDKIPRTKYWPGLVEKGLAVKKESSNC
ncbi:hypothetical protein BY996DRAFT_6537644 [Phakopsora pachyrhizi]|uniref:Uncharacterized protein n=1 Tax=Phakopsora pachyrhizi TaxID=170000 RepID=A0AAV0AZX6_PHAPC|nr:hypothetical protein BY996DRAFT_6537644 [Phakopsora pachyrhizi]CAH7674498.1 hypothetical protein PPACK8108_LOCUS9409 [Phakopsora pachyrhizi]